MSNYPLRLPDNVLAEVKTLAEQNGTSLNQYIGSVIADHVGEMRAIAYFKMRAARADPVAAAAVWARVPNGPPMPGDELLPD